MKVTTMCEYVESESGTLYVVTYTTQNNEIDTVIRKKKGSGIFDKWEDITEEVKGSVELGKELQAHRHNDS